MSKLVCVLGLCLWLFGWPGAAFGQAAFLRLLAPSSGQGYKTKKQKRIQVLQVRLQKLEELINARGRRAAVDKQLFDRELLEYKQLLVQYRQPLQASELSAVRWRPQLLTLGQQCISDLRRIQSVGHLQEQSRRDWRDALRTELEALQQLRELLRKNYLGGTRKELQKRIVTIVKLQQQGELEHKQILVQMQRLETQRTQLHKRLEGLRRRLADLAVAGVEPAARSVAKPSLKPAVRSVTKPSSKPAARSMTKPSSKPTATRLVVPTKATKPTALALQAEDTWKTRVSLLRFNRLRIRVRLLQMLYEEERLNRKALSSRLRLYEFTLALMKRHAKQLARKSEGGLLHIVRLPLHFQWIAGVIDHTRALRLGTWRQKHPKLVMAPVKTGKKSIHWGFLTWLYLVLFVLVAGLLVYALYRFSQRAIDLLTQRAEEEQLLLSLWQSLRLCLRLLRDLASWMIFLIPALWLLYSVLGGSVWWDACRTAAWTLVWVRLGWTLSQRLFSADASHRLLPYISDEKARIFRRTTKTLLSLQLLALPFYELLTGLGYPAAFLAWLVVLYWGVVVFGIVFMLFQRDSILTMMPKNTVFERILIVIMFRVYPLVWMLPLVLFGLYLWGYRNLASYLAFGVLGTLGLLFLTDLLGALLWASILWLLGFTDEDESVLAPPPTVMQVELDPAEGGPALVEVDVVDVAVVEGVASEALPGAEASMSPESGDAQASPTASDVALATPPDAPALVVSVAAEPEVVEVAASPVPVAPVPIAPALEEVLPTALPFLRAARFGYVFIVGLIWLSAAALMLELWQVPGGIRAIPKAFTYPIFQAKDIQITLWVLSQAFGMFVFTMWVSRALPALLDEYLYPTLHVTPASSFVANALLRYFLMCVGVLLCFRLLQVGSQGFLILLAVVALSLSYGLRKLVHNFISSLLIFFGRSIAVGDYIETKKHRGKVKEITARSTTIQTANGKLILIPNGPLLDGPITNWLAAKPYFRDRLDFHVALDSDVKVVEGILRDVAKAHADVQATPKPAVRLREMTGRSLEFGVTVTLLNPMTPGRIRSDLRLGILARFREAGVELALPQQELHLHPEIEARLLDQLEGQGGAENPGDEERAASFLPALSRWRMGPPPVAVLAEETLVTGGEPGANAAAEGSAKNETPK